jgi:Uma2 family endonuclease
MRCRLRTLGLRGTTRTRIDYNLLVAQSLPTAYAFDPEDPRAPALDEWERMSPDERAHVVAMLPPEVPLDLLPNEGDPHRKATRGAMDALDGFFRRTGRRIYLSSHISVYYPAERRFAPDLLAVADVEPHDRNSWVVADEGRGLDLVLEVHVAGHRLKDEKTNVERYARLGIPEYFYFDRTRGRLAGYRLAAPVPGPGARVYQRLVPQAGRLTSQVLGLDLALDGLRLRFFSGNAPLEDADEMIARLGSMLDKVISDQEDAGRLTEELAGKLAEEQRLREEELRLREDLERQLAEVRAENERLKKGASH